MPDALAETPCALLQPVDGGGDGSVRPEDPAFPPINPLIRDLGSIVVGLRPDQSVFEWNREAERVLGHARAEVLGRNFLELVLPPGAGDVVGAEIRHVLGGSGPRSCEGEVAGAGRGRRHVTWTFTRVDDESGRPVGVLASGQDVSERRIADDRFRVLFERSTDAQMLSLDGRIIDCNQTAVDMLRCRDKADVLGRHPAAFSPELQPDGRPSMEKSAELALIARRDGYHRFEWLHRRATGEDFLVEVTLSPVGVNGRDCLLVIWHDITARKQTEAALAAARDAAVAAAQAKTEFMATISHEIRTPMNGILGMTEVLLETPLTGDQRELAETAHASARALLVILNDILDFSKIESERLQIEEVPFDLRQLVEDAIDLMASQACDKGIALVYCIDPRAPRLVMGDSLRLRQVLLNLLTNAVKFTMAGEVALKVLVDHDEDAVQVRFDVTDTGIGISAGDQDRLFQAFTQLDASTTRRFGGTGLGLAISRRLTGLMGGRIGVDSAPGGGSRFWFTVHLPKVMAQTDPPARRPLLGATAVVVEPHPLVRRLAAHVLDELGAAVTAVGSSTMMPPGEWDIVVADCALDAGTGRQATVLFGTRPDEAPSSAATFLPRPIREGSLRRTLLAHLSAPDEQPVTAPAETAAPHGLILLAEDNIVNQRVAQRLVQRLGHHVVVVANGEQALAEAGRQRFDAILMDCQMPVMDGFEAARAIRRLEAPGTRVPIIALTAEALAGDRERCLQAGMDDYLSKPVRGDQLRATLARWMAGTQDRPDQLQSTHR